MRAAGDSGPFFRRATLPAEDGLGRSRAFNPALARFMAVEAEDGNSSDLAISVHLTLYLVAYFSAPTGHIFPRNAHSPIPGKTSRHGPAADHSQGVHLNNLAIKGDEMLGIRFIKVQPTDYVLLYKNGQIVREGAGLSFFYFEPAASIVRIPIASTDVPFIFTPKA